MKKLIAFLLIGVSSTSFAANNGGFYFGTVFGEAKADDAEEFGLTDDTDGAWRVYGGYEFNRWLAVEAGYVDLGSYNGSIPSIEGPVATRVELDGFTLGVRPQYVFSNDWFIQGQAGVLFWDADARLSGGFSGLELGEDGEDPYYGVGFGKYIGKSWRLSAEWTRFETDESEADFLGLALNYRFGK